MNPKKESGTVHRLDHIMVIVSGAANIKGNQGHVGSKTIYGIAAERERAFGYFRGYRSKDIERATGLLLNERSRFQSSRGG